MKPFGLMPADILLPKSDFEKFSVIACDQYTSEPEYWERVKAAAGDAPSALNIILPEIYLEDDADKRIEDINATMQEYLDGGVFNEYKDAMIYLERTTCEGEVRKGIVGLVDLEDYDYSSDSTSLIRATEQTVLERIPPRVKIRKDAALEMPHIMLLVDDPEMSVIEPIGQRKGELQTAYDFDLMCGGGHCAGYFADDAAKESIWTALQNLCKGKDDLLFAVGDGNHSLATAKECYKLCKNEKTRYALVEVVNIHDKTINFEPIYRVLFNVDAKSVIDWLKAKAPAGENVQEYDCIYDGRCEKMELGAFAKLPVGTLQKLLDEYLKEHDEVKIDYIHGVESVKELCKKERTLGFLFEGMKKDELFDAIKQDGSLPRKTFSMGHADDKRFYIEARKIK